ncbi:hypothetical protein OUZ56_017529 [Daphnia magna]|uniref:Uncharacterized protein n=1 Tax=Daphnia magna TaxID=35525 RepID=A0ABR0AT15_9CRUS|nr:hypothetical protein OUZ56_017529 [Daphnia magna]
MSETTIAYKDLGKFAIVDMVVHDFNEERLETALIPDFWLYAFGYKLYCAYPTLIKSRGELVKYSADQSQTYSTKQPHTIGSQAFPDLSFLTSTPNIDVASQNLIIGEAATTLTDSRFVRCNLGDEDSQFPMDNNSETSASETTQTVDG